MQIIFLGTGSPSELDRANAAIAVRLASGADVAGFASAAAVEPAGAAGPATEEVVLFDTAGGNEILRQLRTAEISLASIHHVVVSHQHFDHAAGLGILLLQMSRFQGGEILVYVPAEGAEAIRSVVEIQCPGVINTRLRDRLRFVPLRAGETVELAVAGAQPTKLTAVPATHPVPAMGCVLEWQGKRVGYSGDTSPTAGMAEAFAGVDVLIHESSGLAGTETQMQTMGHSTARDAGRIAAAARVKHLALTHFPARSEQELQGMKDAAAECYDGPITVSSDFTKIRVG